MKQMQTFLPYSDFVRTAKCLDRQRLGKQRVEAMQILKEVHENTQKGWKNHPAVNMWRGHANALARYALAMCDEWISRGYNDTIRQRFVDVIDNSQDNGMPPWFGNTEFHASHRSNLLRKQPEWYSQFGWTEPNDLPYIWPSKSYIVHEIH